MAPKRTKQTEAMRRKVTAYHEAGHAVMDWLWWRENHLVMIDMRGKTGVHAFVKSERRLDRNPDTWPNELRQLNATAMIMQKLAGPAAGSRFDGTGSEWFSVTFEEYGHLERSLIESSDMGLSIKAARAGVGNKRWLSFLEKVAKWTEEAVSHAKVWKIIEALATRLETQQTMQASSAIRIIEKSAGDDWSAPIRLHSLGAKWEKRLPLPVITND